MKTKHNKLIDANSAAIFLFLYGLIIQAAAFPIIYIYNSALRDVAPESLTETLIAIWFCIPVLSVFSIILAVLQIRKRQICREKYKLPLIGLILNSLWLASYLLILYIVFFIVKPF